MDFKHECTLKTDSESHLPKLASDAPFYQKLSRRFRKLTIVSPVSPQCKTYFRSNAAIAFERKRHITSIGHYIIHPFSTFRTYWELWMMVILLLILIIYPIQVAFEFEEDARLDGMSLMVIFLDFVCITDIIITFFTGYGIDATKEVILDPGRIVRHYLFSPHLYLDIMSSLPIELFQYFCQHMLDNTIWRVLRIVELFKIFRFRTFIVYTRRSADMWHINLLFYLTSRYIVILLLLIHWTACLHYAIPNMIFSLTGHLHDKSWIKLSEIDNFETHFEKYVRCVFRACCFLLCINHDVHEVSTQEDIFIGIITYIVGYLFLSLLLVLSLQIVSSVLSAETKYQEIMNQVHEYMGCKQLPSTMQKRLVSYYEYRFQKSYFRENVITAMLSEKLRREINVHCYRRLIDSVSIFKDMPQHVMFDIVNSLKAEIFLPNDIIVKAGTIGECMYFLASGTVCVLTPTGKEVCHLYDGAYFGEIALLMRDQKRIANVVAIEICEVYRLDNKSFNTCFANNTELFNKIEKIAHERREKTLVLEELHKRYISALELAM